MTFTRLETHIITASYGKNTSNELIAGNWVPDKPTPPEADPSQDASTLDYPSAVGLAGIIALSSALETLSTVYRLRKPGSVVLIEVADKAWMPSVTNAAFRMLQPFGKTTRISRGTDPARVEGLTAKFLVISQSRYDRNWSEPWEADARSILSALSFRKPLFFIAPRDGDGISDELRYLFTDTFEIPEPGEGEVRKLLHAFYPPNDRLDFKESELDLRPLTVAAAFATNRGPERTLAILGKSQVVVKPKVADNGLKRFDDIIGMDSLKAWGLAVASDVQAVKRGELAASQLPRGLLIEGPPGVGKTRAVATIAEAIGVPLISGSVGKWLGTGGGHLGSFCTAMRKAFKEARDKAPSILAIDEIDAIGTRGQDSDSHFWDAAIAALLETMDGLDNVPGVIVISMANSVTRLDPALRRSGRLDDHLVISKPDIEALTSMFRSCLAPDLQSEDFTRHAAMAVGATIADIDRLCREARRRARGEHRPILLEDVDHVVERFAPARPIEDLRRTAAHEAGHAVIARLEGLSPFSVSLAASFGSGLKGAVEFLPPTWSWTLDQIRALVRVQLAGRAAETLVMGGPSLGAASDLQAATAMIHDAFATEGMGSSIRWRPIDRLRDLDRMPTLAAEIELELEACNRRVAMDLASHLPAVLRVQKALLAAHHLKAAILEELIENVPAGDRMGTAP